MDKRKILVLSVLAVFVVGMGLASVAAAEAKTVTMPMKFGKPVEKKVGKYVVKTTKEKVSSKKQCFYVAVTKKGKLVNLNKYKARFYYKQNGKKYTTKWYKGNKKLNYIALKASTDLKINKAEVNIKM